MQFILILLAAFFASSGFAAYEHEALKAEQANAKTLTVQIKDYKDAANKNAFAAQSFATQLGVCEKRILSTVDANKRALDERQKSYVALNQALAKVRAQLHTPACREWDSQPSCGLAP